MTSLFSRSRKNSTPNKPQTLPPGAALAPVPSNGQGTSDEFGRVASRQGRAATFGIKAPQTPSKEYLKQRGGDRRAGIASESTDDFMSQIPDGSFLPLNLDRPQQSGQQGHPGQQQDYGYLAYERHVVLGLSEVSALVEVVAHELDARGLTTPFVFTTSALDISAPAIRRLIRAFLTTCARPGDRVEEARWREEARFAGPHELGTCLRWGLARVVRVAGGCEVRGMISWENYLDFRDSEAALGYPATHFPTILAQLPAPLQHTLLTLLTLLARLTAHSAASGHTPPSLSPLFGPLLFGLGPATLPFHHAYIHYLRAVHAMEHLLLAFIRNGAAREPVNTPTRLREWIGGYPAMLPQLSEKHRNRQPQARRGARTAKVVSVRRNVRMYAPDLVKTAASWARVPAASAGAGAGTSANGLAASKEWARVAPAGLRLPPKYSEGYKKRMDLPASFNPDSGTPFAASAGASSAASSPTDYFNLLGGAAEGEDKYRSLTDLKWGTFESAGFGGLEPGEGKLQFDLTESARNARTAKRATLTWTDFSSSGFSRTDAPLSTSLQFTPSLPPPSSLPASTLEMHKKLQKTVKKIPPFGWDTTPVVGQEEVIEEAFVDVFCDLVYGGGWMDVERGEEVGRECNWALVEYKSLPVKALTAAGGSDPRTGTTLMLFEEFVPLEYRQQLDALNNSSSSRSRLPSLFTQSSKNKAGKGWRPAATLNGRPYVVGHVPRSPSYREVEFEGLLRGNASSTKIISLSTTNTNTTNSNGAGSKLAPATIPERAGTPRPPLAADLPPEPMTPARKTKSRTEDDSEPGTPQSMSKRMSRFRMPVPLPSPASGTRKAAKVPAEYSTLDFETRFAGVSDDESGDNDDGDAASGSREKLKQERRQSRDDAWVDILVATHNRRMGSPEDELPGARRDRVRGLRGRRSDPELASMEVAQALAGVRALSPPSDDEFGPRAPEQVSYQGSEHERELDAAPEDREGTEEAGHDGQQQEEDVTSIMEHPRRQMTSYFDLHPERRPKPRTSEEDEDPRARLAQSDESHEDNANPSRVSAIDVPDFATPEEQRHQQETGHSRAESMTLPNVIVPPPRTTSKTAALIEMYRGKEKEGSSPVGLDSRLSLRSVSKESLPLPPTPPVKILTPPPASPTPLVDELEEEPAPEVDSELAPPAADLVASGRDSPARYIHGAPLHNVVEEEEED